MWIWLLGALVALYIFLFFVLSRFIVPFMRLKPIPARIPYQLLDAITQLESETTTPYEYVRAASAYILSQNHGGRIKTILRIDLAFQKDVRTLLRRSGFMHCSQLNHLLRILLVKSKYFTEEHVRLRTTFLNFSVHQYLQVRIAGQWYDVDLWAAKVGVSLGRHASGLR